MAYLMLNAGESSLINTWLGGFAGGTNNVPSSSVYVGLGAKVGGIGSDKSVNNGSNTSTTLAEIGQSTAAGYTRTAVNRNAGGAGGWPVASLSSGSYQSTAPQVTFSFSGTPTLNGATLWFIALGSTVGQPDALFGGDLAATRNFAAGDQEKITITYRQQ